MGDRSHPAVPELTNWAIACAERLLPLFASIRPNDTRVTRALGTALAALRGEATTGAVRAAAFECHAAARDAGGGPPTAAARACAHAVATVLATEHAREIAWYTTKAIPDEDARWAELQWQRAALPPSLHDLVYGT